MFPPNTTMKPVTPALPGLQDANTRRVKLRTGQGGFGTFDARAIRAYEANPACHGAYSD